MLKNKKILLGIFVIILLLVLPNMVKADNENPTVNTEVNGANKSIKVILSNIELEDSDKEYQFGVSKVKASAPTNWVDLQDVDINTCTAIITPDNEDMRIILRNSNKCYLFIKEKSGEDNVIVTQINLPDSLDIKVNTNNKFEINYLYEKCSTFYENLGDYQIAAVKIDNKDIIKKYLSAKENNQNTLNAVKDMLPTEKPSNSWSKMHAGNDFNYTSADYSIKDLIKYEGLYMVWGQVSYKEGRSIYGYTLYDNYPDGYKLPDENREKVDTTTYISFPFIIINGKGSVNLRSGVYDGDYTMSYQFVEVSDSVMNSITDLQNKYKNGDITYEEYFTKYNNTVTKYDDTKWIKTEDGSFEVDRSKFTSTKKFALWVKLEMEDKTVYENQIYTIDGTGTATNNPSSTDKPTTQEKEPQGTTEKKDPTTATSNMPYTGRVILAWIIGIVSISTIVAYVRYKKLYIK